MPLQDKIIKHAVGHVETKVGMDLNGDGRIGNGGGGGNCGNGGGHGNGDHGGGHGGLLGGLMGKH